MADPLTLVMMEFHFCLSSADWYAPFIDKPEFFDSVCPTKFLTATEATTCNTSLHNDLLKVVPLSSGYVTKVLKLVFVNFWGQGGSFFSYQIPNKNIGLVFFPWHSQHSPPAIFSAFSSSTTSRKRWSCSCLLFPQPMFIIIIVIIIYSA